MSRSIRSYPESQRVAVIKRRRLNRIQGLGFWAAKDAPLGLLERQAAN